MQLYHATTRACLASIESNGLLLSHCDPQAKTKAVWLHSAYNSPWAILHTQSRHHAALEDVVILEVSIPRGWLTRFRSGLWYSRKDVPVSRIVRVIPSSDYAQSAK
jgi:hypothetical protein